MERPDSNLNTGIPGLDQILWDGLLAGTMHLIKGLPGTGKTTMGLQFLLEGAQRGENVLYLGFSESALEFEQSAQKHGWSLEGVQTDDLSPLILAQGDEATTIFHPSDVELPTVLHYILQKLDEVKPTRLVFDSLSELRNLAESRAHFRRTLLSLKQALEQRNVTSLFLEEAAQAPDVTSETIAHGVISLEQWRPSYGPVRRRLYITKMRGAEYLDGYHDFEIKTGGVIVFPRIRPRVRTRTLGDEPLKSGVAGLDDMLGGGIDRGTTTMLMGPSGSGKSTLGLHYALQAAACGQRAVLFAFDEDIATIRRRADTLGLDLDSGLDSGRIRIHVVDSAELSPGEFACRVQEEVEDSEVSLVTIDSLNGYLFAMPDERALVPHLHDIFAFLGRRGVTTFCILALSGMLESSPVTNERLSYLADTVILLRFFEAQGNVRTAVAVMKQRTGRHERRVRELLMGPGGMKIGDPLALGKLLGSSLDTSESGDETDPTSGRSDEG